MRTKRIRLVNFGGFREFEAVLDAPIVGLLGPNGAGKSTLLKAIEFLYTGELGERREPLESFVRKVEDGCMEPKPETAIVEGDFRKGGTDGYVMRKIGKSPKRALKWGNMEKPLTKAADVDKLMAEIFQADKQAVANAIFLKQGELDKLLFGDQADRERLFMKLLLIGHFSTIETAVDAQISRLTALCGDNSALLDEMRSQRGQATDQLAALQKDLGQIQIPTGVNEARVLATTLAYLQQATASYAGLENGSQAILNALETAATDMCACTGLQRIADTATLREQLRQWIKARQQDRDLAENQRQETVRTITLWEKLVSIRARRDTLTDQYANNAVATQALKDRLAAFPADLDARIAAFKNLADAQDRKRQAEVAVQQARTGMEGAAAANESAQKALSDHDTANADTVHQLTESVSLLKVQVELLDKVIHAHTTGDTCALCSQPITRKFTEQDLQHTKASLGNKQAQLAQLAAARNTLAQAAEKAARNLVVAKHTHEQVIASMAKAETDVAAFAQKTAGEDLPALQAQAQERRGLEQQIAANEARDNEIHRQVTVAAGEATPSQWSWLEHVERDFTLESQRKLADELAATAALASTVLGNPVLEHFNKTAADADKCMSELNAAAAQIRKYADEKARLQALFAGRAMNVEDPEALKIWIGDAEALMARRSSIEGQCTAVNEQIAQLSARIRVLEDAAQKQERIKLTLDEMRLLKRTFSRQGLPATYMSYRFEQLVELTQHYLAALGADFMVMSDFDSPITFLFKRVNDPTAAWLSQEKLSGGQRVRLTVAFLLAVQKLIIPEVGLLVLDEPSVHLDAEGVESLVELFANLSSILSNSDSQVIICDHHPTLARAMGTVIEISPPKPYELPAVPAPVAAA